MYAHVEMTDENLVLLNKGWKPKIFLFLFKTASL